MQPPENLAKAEELIGVFREAQANLAAELASVLDDPNEVRRRVRLREQLRTVSAYRNGLEEAARSWISGALPDLYAAGAAAAAADVGTVFAWTAPHVEAVQAFADTVWTDVAQRLDEMESSTKRALRQVARDTTRQVVAEGRTTGAASRAIEQWMGENGVGTVTYRNGAKHLAADYADTLARTATANVFNEGTFNQLEADGVEWAEVSDGPDCGWERHDDTDKANGTVRRVSDCREHGLSHPRCARSFQGRPEITTEAQAAKARAFTPEQQTQMAAEERERAASAPRTLSGRSRQPRQARTPRQPRAARASA